MSLYNSSSSGHFLDVLQHYLQRSPLTTKFCILHYSKISFKIKCEMLETAVTDSSKLEMFIFRKLAKVILSKWFNNLIEIAKQSGLAILVVEGSFYPHPGFQLIWIMHNQMLISSVMDQKHVREALTSLKVACNNFCVRNSTWIA